MIALQIRQIEVLPGQRAILHDLNWEQFEGLLSELGEKRATRIAYFEGTLEIRMPLPEHERAKVLISNLIVVILDVLAWEWESLGSTTFKNSAMQAGLEPDDCFYIQNYRAVIGLKRFDFTQTPPPDLAIEVDLTSKTQVSAYQALKVPEIWRYENGKLVISVLHDNGYTEASQSRAFPDLPVVELISDAISQGETEPMSAIRRIFQRRIQDYLNQDL
jgi:Uma2 family endonuclease